MAEQDIKAQAQQIVDKVKELVKDGSASRIYLKRKGETVLNISLNAGIIGAVIGLSAAPFVVLASALVSFGLDCEIEIEKKDGTIINLNNTEIGSKLENAKSEVKDKAKEFFSNMETKGEDVEVEAEDVE
jgi:hypothetical protein